MTDWQAICRVEILADEVHMPKFETCLAEAGATHWTVRPLARGRQGDNQWNRSGHIVDAGRQAALVCFLPPETLDGLVATLDPLLKAYDADLYCQHDWRRRSVASD
ncbi:hypothetical protein [uncultured Maricaulis sp.]|uniref:hypothetical protein n=1 Tax=uncultured Maricaulis sp. TaxID=174710 RepID=UPI002608CB2A|nr:hypothetical protein [uncultured Maricaulis sp.]